MRKKNVVVLLADDQRYNTIHALGNDEIITPNFDKLAENGVAFTNAHIMGGTNGAICMPSRATLNTGRQLFHLPDEGQSIACEHTTIGQSFQNAGYNTCGIGKWHNGTESYARSFTDGANIFFGGMWDHWNVPVCDYHADGVYDRYINYTPNFFFDNKSTRWNCDRINAGVHSTELMAGAAIDYINSYDSEKPFYMYVAFLAPHDPRTMPEKFREMYNKDDIILPPNFIERHPIDFGIEGIRDEVLANYPRGEDEIRQHIADYYGMISHIDDALGRVIKALEDKGELDNTIIVFAADNGLAIGSHGLMGKQNLYEESVRVPLIISGCDIPKGVVTNEYACLFDLYPTLCSLCGFDKPESVETVDLSPVIFNGESVRDEMYLAYADSVRGIKSSDYKLIEYRTDKLSATQLFNLADDPYELNSIDDENIIAQMRERMYYYRDLYGDAEHRIGKQFWNRYK
jgi:Arylsulfatase A and related enzymes